MSNRAIRGQAFNFSLTLDDVASSEPRKNPSFVTGDVLVIKDGGTPANITNLPTLNASDDTEVEVLLTAEEMDAEWVVVKFNQLSKTEWTYGECRILTTEEPIALQSTLESVKERTDRLPAQPAAVGDSMTLEVGAIQAATFSIDAISADALSSAAATKISTDVDSVLDPRFVSMSGKVDAVHNRTQNLPESPAATGDFMRLTSDGLDRISVDVPSGVATNFREMIVQLWRRFFGKVEKTTNEIITYADDDETRITTQTYSRGPGRETVDKAT